MYGGPTFRYRKFSILRFEVYPRYLAASPEVKRTAEVGVVECVVRPRPLGDVGPAST